MATGAFVATHAIENRYEPAKGEDAMARFLPNAMAIGQPHEWVRATLRRLKSRLGQAR